MKKTYFVALATLMAAFACTKEANLEKEQAPVQGHAVTLGVEIPATKIDYTDNGSAIHPVWQEGDKIEVVFGGTKEIFTLASGEGTQSAKFTKEDSMLEEGMTYAVYYPSQEYDWSVQDGTLEHLPNYMIKTGLNSLKTSIDLQPKLTYFVLNFTEAPGSVTDGALSTKKVYLQSDNGISLYNRTQGDALNPGIITVNHEASFAADGTPTDAKLYVAAYISGETNAVTDAFTVTFMNGEFANKAKVRNYSWTWTPSSNYSAGNAYASPTKTNGFYEGTVIGAKDNSTGWWAAFSEYFNIPVGKKLTLDFINFGDEAENWHNWVSVVTNDVDRGGAGYSEYFALRADHHGWGGQFRKSEISSNFDWDIFKAELDGAQVSLSIEHVKDGYALVKTTIKTKNNTWFENYYQTTSKTEDIRAFLTVEKAHLVLAGISMEDSNKVITGITASAQANVIGTADKLTISPDGIVVEATFDDGEVICLNRGDYTVTITGDKIEFPTSATSVENIASVSYTSAQHGVLNATVNLTIATSAYSLTETSLGATDNSTEFWAAQLANDFPVAVGTSETIGLNFVSSAQNANWNSVDVILRDFNKAEYGVVRTDNYGWQGEKNTADNNDVLGWTLTSNWNWANYWTSLVGKKVYISISNNRSISKADIRYKIGDDTYQYYGGISVDNINVYANLTIDKCHITFMK